MLSIYRDTFFDEGVDFRKSGCVGFVCSGRIYLLAEDAFLLGLVFLVTVAFLGVVFLVAVVVFLDGVAFLVVEVFFLGAEVFLLVPFVVFLVVFVVVFLVDTFLVAFGVVVFFPLAEAFFLGTDFLGSSFFFFCTAFTATIFLGSDFLKSGANLYEFLIWMKSPEATPVFNVVRKV